MGSSGSFDAFPDWFGQQIKGPWQKTKADAERISKQAISLTLSDALILSQLVYLGGGRKWIELGTLTGFSAIAIANGFRWNNSKLWTIERDSRCAQISRENLAFDSRIEVVEATAIDALQSLASHGPFDGIFFDATKSEYQEYFLWAEANLAPLGMILADNVFLGERPSFLVRGEGQTESKSRWSEEARKRMADFLTLAFDSQKYRTSIVPSSDGLLVAVLRGTSPRRM